MEEEEKEIDFTDSFNTELNSREQADYQLWLLEEKYQTGKDWLRDLRDYDVQGFFKAGETLEGGHGTDRFKKQAHPSFSNQSIYHGAEKDGKLYLGGEWGRKGDHDTFRPHPKMLLNKTHTVDGIKKYFDMYEKGNELITDYNDK
jgi:hypothetical protein